MASGSVAVNGFVIEPRDGVAITGETCITFEALDAAEVILIETV